MSETARAWGWHAHLRDGGTTPWDAWAGTAEAAGRVLPGAQQLELLRRLNAASGGVDAVLAERVLTATAAGRGPVDLPLLGTPATWGPRPVDPAALPARQLLRVATTILAEDVAEHAPAPQSRPAGPVRVRKGLRDHVLLGDPLAVADAASRASGPAWFPATTFAVSRRAVVFAGPFDRLLAHTWTYRCFDDGVARWGDWLDFWSGRDQPPPRLDLAAAARSAGVCPRQVRVLTDSSAACAWAGAPLQVPGADVADLARRIAGVLRILLPRDRAAAVMATWLMPRMPRTATPPVAVGDRHREWVERLAADAALEIRRAGYSVVGDLGDLAPRPAEDVSRPRGVDAAALDLAVAMLVDDTWKSETRRHP